MTTELKLKIIRGVVIGIIFLGMVTLQGITDLREANQQVFMVLLIGSFSLLISNVWIMAFLLWTCFLFTFFKFTGGVYLSNIFLGCIFYTITKVGFKKEHINLFINGFLWFLFVNVAYMSVQTLGYEFIFTGIHQSTFIEYFESTHINGFMGDDSIMSQLMALAIPILASRNNKVAMAAAIGLFFPLYLAKTSLCFLAGLIGFLFVLYFKVPRRWFISMIVVLALVGGVYLKKVDRLGTERLPLWKTVMHDAMIHPITGWGLDSFRSVTAFKDFRYYNQKTVEENVVYQGKTYDTATNIQYWDNPHNLIVSICFEFGVIGLFICGGYVRKVAYTFYKAVKTNNAIGLFGFFFVFLLISMGHFPAFLARMMAFSVPMLALLEVELE